MGLQLQVHRFNATHGIQKINQSSVGLSSKDFMQNADVYVGIAHLFEWNRKSIAVKMGRGISNKVLKDRIEFEHGMVLIGITDFGALNIDYHSCYCPQHEPYFIEFSKQHTKWIVINL